MKLIFAGFFLCGSDISQGIKKPPPGGGGVDYRLIPFKQHHSSSLVTSGQVVSGMVEFDGRDDVRWRARVS